MNCAYHTYNPATVSCNGCGKPLCPACDHRVKGFPYCQDCIVQGVDLLRSHNQSSNSSYIQSQTSPFAALILSVCPGLGAAYNGQTHKALIHFAISVGLLQMAINLKMPSFFLAFLGMWLYSAVDAWKTARLIRSGAKPDLAEDIFVQRFSGNPKLWGVLLTILGSTFLIRMVLGDRFSYLMSVMLPFFLIGLGLYILRSYIFKPKEIAPDYSDLSHRAEMPNFVGAAGETNYQNGNFDIDNDYPTRLRAKSWKNR